MGQKLAESMEHRGERRHPVILVNRQRTGDLHHRIFWLKDRGPPVMGDKEKFVLGKMAGDGEGPHGVAVQGAVDAVQDFGHGPSIDQRSANDNGKIFVGEGARVADP